MVDQTGAIAGARVPCAARPTDVNECDAIVFDCDGVLVDSETLANDALRSVLAELGWQLSAEQCQATFVGRSLPDTIEVVREHFAPAGVDVGTEWTKRYKERRDAAIAAQLTPMPGVGQLLDAADARFGGRMAVASNSPRGKLEMQLEITGLLEVFGPTHVFSGMDMARPKPAGDVYLVAAGSLTPPSTAFAVLEDSPTGVRAGVAAGAYVLGLSTIYQAHELVAAGAARTCPELGGVAELLRP